MSPLRIPGIALPRRVIFHEWRTLSGIEVLCRAVEFPGSGGHWRCLVYLSAIQTNPDSGATTEAASEKAAPWGSALLASVAQAAVLIGVDTQGVPHLFCQGDDEDGDGSCASDDATMRWVFRCWRGVGGVLWQSALLDFARVLVPDRSSSVTGSLRWQRDAASPLSVRNHLLCLPAAHTKDQRPLRLARVVRRLLYRHLNLLLLVAIHHATGQVQGKVLQWLSTQGAHQALRLNALQGFPLIVTALCSVSPFSEDAHAPETFGVHVDEGGDPAVWLATFFGVSSSVLNHTAKLKPGTHPFLAAWCSNISGVTALLKLMQQLPVSVLPGADETDRHDRAVWHALVTLAMLCRTCETCLADTGSDRLVEQWREEGYQKTVQDILSVLNINKNKPAWSAVVASLLGKDDLLLCLNRLEHFIDQSLDLQDKADHSKADHSDWAGSSLRTVLAKANLFVADSSGYQDSIVSTVTQEDKK